MLTGSDILDPWESKINFACPSENVLREINPYGEALPAQYKPDFLEEVIQLKATKDDKRSSYVLTFDGKKAKSGMRILIV